MIEIYPSIISSDLLNIEKTLDTFDFLCDGYHVDVMDNHFVPNLTWGPVFVNAILSKTDLPLHVHFMVTDPASFLSSIHFRDIDTFCFHYESLRSDEEVLDLIEKIKSKNIKVGIAIKPKTSQEQLVPFLGKIDQVLIMSVEPGFSGQKFLDTVSIKINFFSNYKINNDVDFKIAIDGGINHSNICRLYNLGVEQFALAAAIFHSEDPIESLKKLYACKSKY